MDRGRIDGAVASNMKREMIYVLTQDENNGQVGLFQRSDIDRTANGRLRS